MKETILTAIMYMDLVVIIPSEVGQGKKKDKYHYCWNDKIDAHEPSEQREKTKLENRFRVT